MNENKTAAETNKQIRFIVRHGKNKVQYRHKMVNGEWDKYWFHLTISEAWELLGNGVAEMYRKPEDSLIA